MQQRGTHAIRINTLPKVVLTNFAYSDSTGHRVAQSQHQLSSSELVQPFRFWQYYISEALRRNPVF